MEKVGNSQSCPPSVYTLCRTPIGSNHLSSENFVEENSKAKNDSGM